MTEKQGGSDVRANTTVARPLNGGGGGAEYELTGHKWFCSAPMSDLFLVLAQAESAERRGRGSVVLSAAAHPARRHAQRVAHPALEGQARQPLERLLGDRAARRLGADGGRARARRADDHRDGRPHAPGLRDRRRRGDARGGRATPPTTPPIAAAFGKLLIDQPLMGNVLADLCLESEAARRWRCAWRAPMTKLSRRSRRPRRARTRATRSCSSAWRPRSASTGPASAPPTTRSRRWSASAATATSRSRACRGSTARRRWPRSGRARAT